MKLVGDHLHVTFVMMRLMSFQPDAEIKPGTSADSDLSRIISKVSDIEEINTMRSKVLATSSIMEWQQPSRQNEMPCIRPSLSYDSRMETIPGNTTVFG